MQVKIIGENQSGQRLDKYLKKLLPQAGTGFLYKMLRKKNITLNGKKAEGSELLQKGDEVKFFFSEETFIKFTGSQEQAEIKTKEYRKAYQKLKGIEVLYEDAHILVLNKPAGILSQKAAPEDSSLNEWMLGYLLQEKPSLEKELSSFKPSVCNRLDINTSGIVLCGKSLPGLQYLSQCIKERSVQKFYRTVCTGCLDKGERISGYLKKDEKQNQVQIMEEKPDGEDAFYQPVHPFGGRADYRKNPSDSGASGKHQTSFNRGYKIRGAGLQPLYAVHLRTAASAFTRLPGGFPGNGKSCGSSLKRQNHNSAPASPV